jgi:hypothetical protein
MTAATEGIPVGTTRAERLRSDLRRNDRAEPLERLRGFAQRAQVANDRLRRRCAERRSDDGTIDLSSPTKAFDASVERLEESRAAQRARLGRRQQLRLIEAT